ncbi:hypothetical protein P692DRAFT_20131914 [Suillus brevipes Sb2]|nr:hypothetical protein P692DRAFT_20131914 [Suillus brevipes Sb2]
MDGNTPPFNFSTGPRVPLRYRVWIHVQVGVTTTVANVIFTCCMDMRQLSPADSKPAKVRLSPVLWQILRAPNQTAGSGSGF